MENKNTADSNNGERCVNMEGGQGSNTIIERCRCWWRIGSDERWSWRRGGDFGKRKDGAEKWNVRKRVDGKGSDEMRSWWRSGDDGNRKEGTCTKKWNARKRINANELRLIEGKTSHYGRCKCCSPSLKEYTCKERQ